MLVELHGKHYWYGSGGEILAETDASGNTLNEYIFFAGERIAMVPAGSNPIYYAEDMLGSSRIMATAPGTVSPLCYDADFDPYGGEHAYTNTCSQNYKFEGKERDTETGNDDFGARYYTSRFGRWLSADWSSVPVPVPYANLTNPQTLNLYSMVSDDPESFADLDGHVQNASMGLSQPGDSGGPTCAAAGAGGTGSAGSASCGAGQTANQTEDQQQAAAAQQQAQQQNPDTTQNNNPEQPQGNQPNQPNQVDKDKDKDKTPGTTAEAGGQSGGGGQQPKGERRITRKPEFKDKGDKLPKGVRPKPGKPGEYQVKNPHTGNWVDKPRGWSPYAKVGIGVAIVTGAVIVGHAIASCFGSGACEFALALAF